MRRVLFLLPLLIGARVQAQTQCVANPASCSTPNATINITITIGRAFQLDLAPASTSLATPTPAIYDAGYAATTGPTAAIRSNAPWTLGISASTATWPATDTQTEPARTNKPSTDLLWAIASGGPFTGLTTTAATVATGIASAGTNITIFYRTLYSWTLDTPGNYSLTVVFTVTSP